MFFKKKKEKDPLISGAIKEISKIKNLKQIEVSIQRLNEILRIFLDKKYGLHQSLTIKELIPLVKKKRIEKPMKENLVFLLLEFYDMEYMQDEGKKYATLRSLIQKTRQFILSSQL